MDIIVPFFFFEVQKKNDKENPRGITDQITVSHSHHIQWQTY